MRIATTITSLLFAAGLATAPLAAADTYTVDTSHTAAVFNIKHMDLATAWGRFNDITGEFTWDAADAAKSSFSLTVKIESVDTANAKRDDHLRNADFFNAKQFPTATFASKKVTKIDDATFTVDGDFTIMGTAKPVSLTVIKIGEGKDPWGGYRMGFDTSLTIKRSDFGMPVKPGVGDVVNLMISVEGIKK